MIWVAVRTEQDDLIPLPTPYYGEGVRNGDILLRHDDKETSPEYGWWIMLANETTTPGEHKWVEWEPRFPVPSTWFVV